MTSFESIAHAVEKVFKNTSISRTPMGDSMAGISSTMALLNMLAVEMPTFMLSCGAVSNINVTSKQ